LALFMGGERMLNKALSQAMRPEAAKEAAGPPAKFCVVRAEAPLGSWPPRTKYNAWVIQMLAVSRHLPC
jgi:hypothetical protein